MRFDLSAMTTKKKIFIAGNNGMVGQAMCRAISKMDNVQVISAPRKDLDLTRQDQVEEYVKLHKPDEIYVVAAKVGGIVANRDYPAQFIYENLMIESNIINVAHKEGVSKLIFFGSSCIYPKLSKQPIKEEYLLTGLLEPTNEPYAIAKIAGIKLCESFNRQYGTDFRSVMPSNLYGPGDNYNPKNSHVIPGLISRFHKAKINGDESVTVWGSGNALREFMHVDDLANAVVFLGEVSKEEFQDKTHPMCAHVNIGSGEERSIGEIANIIKNITDYEGKIIFDTSIPDGTPRKILDSSLMRSFNWEPKINLEQGLEMAYSDYLNSLESGSIRI